MSTSNDELIMLRHKLHQGPELSGEEKNTATLFYEKLKELSPDELYSNLGGFGVAAVFSGKKSGPTILFRTELDALPIDEILDIPYRSAIKGISHKCGHDGHMAIIFGLAQDIAKKRPTCGRVIILFQPAEETGEGARAIVNDPQFSKLVPDYCFALHNLPGHPMGQVMLRSGAFTCASRGMVVKLKGYTAHAAYPETGRSPALALAEFLETFPKISSVIKTDEFLMTTTTHASMGEPALGIAPADATFMVNLRSETNQGMNTLVDNAKLIVKNVAKKNKLEYDIEWTEIFDANFNDEECVKQVVRAAEITGHAIKWLNEPFRWAEDFGAISASAKGAMFAFGAGENNPQIHNSDYDFPDELIDRGKSIFYEIYKNYLL
jgi:amidohydrolase